jgi:hypothetical protein
MQAAALALTAIALAGFSDDLPVRRTAREALRPFNHLVGTWRALGTPEGRLQDKQKGLWEETIRWEWQFKDADAWLKVSFDKGKYFSEGTLRYLPDQGRYQLSLKTADQGTVAFTGPLKEGRLIVERQDERAQETQRLILSLLYDNRYLYHYETQSANSSLVRRVYRVGATKEGMPLVKASDQVGPFCVVSYGPPLSPVEYRGKTYYVC